MGTGTDLTLFFALFAGLASFVSPCVLPLVPTYITYLAGSSLEELTSVSPVAGLRGRVLVNALAFIAGFSIVFILFGLSASLIGQFLQQHQTVIRKVSGIFIVFFGLTMMGVFNPGFLKREHRVQVTSPGGAGLLNSFGIGALFSAGWTPCVGPILASIFLLAASSQTIYYGGVLLATYSLGLAIPFFLTALFLNYFLRFARRLYPLMARINLISGLLLVVVGVMMYFNLFFRLSGLIRWGF